MPRSVNRGIVNDQITARHPLGDKFWLAHRFEGFTVDRHTAEDLFLRVGVVCVACTGMIFQPIDARLEIRQLQNSVHGVVCKPFLSHGGLCREGRGFEVDGPDTRSEAICGYEARF